jgi:hypothetical protein
MTSSIPAQITKSLEKIETLVVQQTENMEQLTREVQQQGMQSLRRDMKLARRIDQQDAKSKRLHARIMLFQKRLDRCERHLLKKGQEALERGLVV